MYLYIRAAGIWLRSYANPENAKRNKSIQLATLDFTLKCFSRQSKITKCKYLYLYFIETTRINALKYLTISKRENL